MSMLISHQMKVIYVSRPPGSLDAELVIGGKHTKNIFQANHNDVDRMMVSTTPSHAGSSDAPAAVSWLQLPPEVLVMIMALLPYMQRRKARLTCKIFKDAVTSIFTGLIANGAWLQTPAGWNAFRRAIYRRLQRC